MIVRAMVKLPSGDEDALAGSEGYSAFVWAETSDAFPSSAGSRRWLYAAKLGMLAGEAPEAPSGIGGRFIVFGRFGVTWRALEDVHLKRSTFTPRPTASPLWLRSPTRRSCWGWAGHGCSAIVWRSRTRSPKTTAPGTSPPTSASMPPCSGDGRRSRELSSHGDHPRRAVGRRRVVRARKPPVSTGSHVVAWMVDEGVRQSVRRRLARGDCLA